MTEKRTQVHSGTRKFEVSEREVLHGKLARELAAEGIVLLKNEDLLPLDRTVPIALLGNGASKTVKGGIGSGEVNSRENISIYRGLKEAGVPIVSEEWLQEYDACYQKARLEWKEKVLEDAKKVENPFDAYAENPFALPTGRKIENRDIEGAKAAIYVISRSSGEGKDRRAVKGDYYLSEREEEELRYLDQKKLPIVLVLNVGGPVELTDLLEETEHIHAILNISQLGQEGGYAVADVLYGENVPGGRLTTTWARRYEDYPYAETYSYLNGNLEKEEYKEGIYVGYRYFDSFGVKPLFPFGYGLSYTSFEMELAEIQAKGNSVQMEVLVKNTGTSYAGREVVQVYATLPQTDLEKEFHRLVGFAKTAVLQPGESQKVSITIEQKNFASFSEEKQGWMIEKGLYGIWIGQHSGSLKKTALLSVEETKVVEETHTICPRQAEFEELTRAQKNVEEENQNLPVVLFVPEKEEKRSYTTYSAKEQEIDELIPLLYGNITQGASTLGSAGIRVPGSAGETTEALEDTYGVPSLIMADGPAGLRLRQSYEVDQETDQVYGGGVLCSLENGFLEDRQKHEHADTYYQFCTAFPIGTALAQTWDKDLMRRFGEAIAKEMKEFSVDLWLAPGMNIHRNPLCGRNYEYYSEDPFLAGTIAAAVTAGVQSQGGCGVTIKHFACNNQEDNRMGVDVCVSERALREIYVRGFEIAVKEAAPEAIMTSYNLINGIHAANHRNLCTVLAREEWGFDGVFMSDWNTTYPEDGSIPWQCAMAGNDIIMPGCPEDDRNIREAYQQGKLSEEEIRSCAGRIIALAKRLHK